MSSSGNVSIGLAQKAKTVKGDERQKHREVLSALSGLFVAMFVILTSSTIVSTSMPVIIADLKGTQIDYTWIVTAALLTMAISTPIWAKLGDFVSRKLLLQIALGLFVVASVAAGFADNATTLMVWRAVSGLSMGGLMAVSQVVMADLVSPRERGRYMGIMGAIMLVSQLGSPILGGWLTDAFGWRWNFWVMAPFSLVAFFLLQVYLHLPKHYVKTKLDWVGIGLITAGVSALLIWISLGGKDADSGGFAWDSSISILLGVGSIVTILGAVAWELFGSKDPLIPLRLFKQRTFAFAVLASIPIGIAQFGAAVFLAQYMQLARGYSPTESGLMIFPMVIGSLVASVGVGQLVSRTGKWKPFVVSGAVIFTIGAFLLSTVHYNSDQWLVSTYMFLLGLGMGACMQNLVLVTQNSLPASKLSSGTGTLTFLRTLGGAAGVTVLGSILASALPGSIKTGLAGVLGATPAEQGAFLQSNPECADSLATIAGGTLPAMDKLCTPVKLVLENSYGDNIAQLFLPMAILGILTVIFAALLPSKPLSQKTAVEQIEEELGGEEWALRAPEDGGAPDTSSIEVVRNDKRS
jgi:EmrB/QacA subfamily drug resistance transporter